MKPTVFVKHALATVLAATLLTACEHRQEGNSAPAYRDTPPATKETIYRIAVHPLHNPKKLIQSYQPLAAYLEQNIPGIHFEIEASRDYGVYEQKFRTRDAELLLPNPWQTLEAIKAGYHVIAMMGDAEDFKGIILVRRDSKIHQVADLRNKIVAYPAPTALAAAIMPQYFLHTHGLNVTRDIRNQYVGSQESSIMHVALGEAAAAATWPPPWRAFQKERPEEAAKLKVMWETRPLVNNSFMVRDNVPDVIRDKLRALLLDLPNHEDGRAILAAMETPRIHAANDASYAPVRDFIRDFEHNVRTVETK